MQMRGDSDSSLVCFVVVRLARACLDVYLGSPDVS